MANYILGFDFGTESARAALVDSATGDIVSTAVHDYADGVIHRALPGQRDPLPQDWALQNPGDWLAALGATTAAVLSDSGVEAESVVGIGVDFTSCTVLPTRADGTPLCRLDAYRDRPHAWPKLWKHHASQPQADRINELAAARKERWLARYGGKISSEWLMPKALQILADDPEIYAAMDHIVEGADWVAWQLSGSLARNSCCAGYKATWHKGDGFPSSEFLAALHKDFVDLYSKKVAGPIVGPGTRIGGLTAPWAGRLGLKEGTPVAAPIIDAHAATLGGGVAGAGVMFMIMGTSTCHMLMAEKEVLAEGISGVVEDGIVPGLFGYEAGQAAVGDIFAWFVQNGVPPVYEREAVESEYSIHELLSRKASGIAPGESGLLALDWWNGNRSTLVDAELGGLIVGCTLATRPEEIYRSLIEATAFGTRVIIEAFTDQGVPVRSVVAGGGLTKNAMLLQIYADVTGREVAVAGAEQVSALGAAMLGAVAAGRKSGGYDSLADAAAAMSPPPQKVHQPVPEHQAIYESLYTEYRRLYDYFGRGENQVMKLLRRLRKG